MSGGPVRPSTNNTNQGTNTMPAAPPPRPMYGVSRIDQPEKKNHGWYVRVTYKGKTEQKFFADKSNGGKTKALKAAQGHRDHLVTLLPPNRQEAASRKRASSKKKAGRR